jgi:HSP90 family molecular chaperone
MMTLGVGTSQHALIAGKTGSGKSTLLHALITNLALWYSPDEVEFYLVDFKKGVEFKTYATHRLPHARVVAVESDKFMTGTMRRTLKMMGKDPSAAGMDSAPDLEINPRHPVVVKLNQLRQSDATLAGLVAEQLFDQARLASGRLEDPRAMLQRMNTLLSKVVGA